MAVIEIIKRNFDNEVMFSDRPLLLEFFSEASADCQAIAGDIEELARENLGVKVCAINIHSEPDIAKRFEVDAVPTLIAFKTGKIRAREVGVISKAAMLEMLTK